MNTINVFLLLSALSFATAVLADGHSLTLTRQQIDSLGISLGKLQPVEYIPIFSAPAKVVVPPAHEFVVSTSQPGLIEKMNASIGDKVNKGEVLALINSPELLTLQGNYLKAVSALKLAAATYNRNKKLRMEGVLSGRNEQEAYSAYNAAAVEVSEARQLLSISGMSAADIKQLDATGKLASRLTIRSPISGRIIDRMASSGSRVDNLAPLFRIANLDELWLEINIPQEHIGDLKPGDLVRVENGLAEAVVKVVGQNVNPENQTIPARALIKTGSPSVRVGQKVTVQAARESKQVSYLLPDSAIVRNAGKAYIFIRTGEGFKVSEVAVLGKRENGSVISGGLTGDETIAIENTVTLKANWLGLGSNE